VAYHFSNVVLALAILAGGTGILAG
jgi:hypothetical protein